MHESARDRQSAAQTNARESTLDVSLHTISKSRTIMSNYYGHRAWDRTGVGYQWPKRKTIEVDAYYGDGIPTETGANALNNKIGGFLR